MEKITTILLFLMSLVLSGQSDLYFPPIDNTQEWESISPESQDWCTDKIDELINFLDEKDTKSFIILKDGKIIIEEYFGTYTQDSFWYWASAAKSLTAFLIGMAQEDGYIDINNKTSDYLGQGWSSEEQDKEDLITIKHQLTMTTGLNDDVTDSNCTEPDCLEYLTNAGSRWAYHNAPYRLLHDIIEVSSGSTLNQYTNTVLGDQIGMKGFWFGHTRFSRARDMARFGLLLLGNGIWNENPILSDSEYFQNMINTSQDFNLSYGYLFWLNGKENFMLPSSQIVFNYPLVPNAPSDMYAALGKYDQKLHIIPSLNMVLVRQGEGSGSLVPTTFDNEIWDLLNQIICTPDITRETKELNIKTYPNPISKTLMIEGDFESKTYNISVYNSFGIKIQYFKVDLLDNKLIINLGNIQNGIYFLSGIGTHDSFSHKIFKE